MLVGIRLKIKNCFSFSSRSKLSSVHAPSLTGHRLCGFQKCLCFFLVLLPRTLPIPTLDDLRVRESLEMLLGRPGAS